MAEADQTPALKKEAMKQLRQARRHTIQAATIRMKEQQKAIKAIKAELQEGERTVPELAAAIGLPADSVLWYIMALKKYGQVAEGEAEGSYFRYRLSQPLAAETEPGSSELE
jgi:predicted transcriptional regulator